MDEVERVARVLCSELGPDSYDDLPEVASYIQRKSTTRPILDRVEARDIAQAAIDAMRAESPPPASSVS